jgi:L-fuculose-phosphate aldolase/L-ribulose-5-phosphate 4-epimerase
MKLKDQRKKILQISEDLMAAGVIHNGQGNFSIYDRDSGLVAITPSAVPYEDRQVEDICVVDLDGNLVEGNWKPTSEINLHLIFYKRRSDVNAVIHTHAMKSTVFGVIGNEPLPMILIESATAVGGDVPIAPYVRPGTKEFAEVSCDAVGDGFSAILAHHGLVTVGETIDLAFCATVAVEATAEIVLMARSMGVEPVPLADDEVKFMRELFLGYKPRTA